MYRFVKKLLLFYPLIIAIGLFSIIHFVYDLLKWFDDYKFIYNLYMAFAITTPLLITVSILSHNNRWKEMPIILRKLAGAITTSVNFFVLYYFEIEDNYRLIYGIVLLILTSLFFLFYSRSKKDSFWNFSRQLVLRLIITVLIGGVYIGVTFLFVVVKDIFHFYFEPEIDMVIALILFFIAVPWNFTTTTPHDYITCNRIVNWSVLIKVLRRYILLALSIIYAVVLYQSIRYIVISTNWPYDMVTYLIADLSLLGILILFDRRKSSEFISTYHIAIVPLILIYFMGIWVLRVYDYGLTLNRYVLIVFGIFQTGVALYYIMGKRDIRYILSFLFLTVLGSLYGPLSAYPVCENSQSARFIQVLNRNQLLLKGKIIDEQYWFKDGDDIFLETEGALNNDKISERDRNELTSIILYLSENHSTDQIETVFSVKTPHFENSWKNKNIILGAMGIDYQSNSKKRVFDGNERFRYDFKRYNAIAPSEEYDHVILLTSLLYLNKSRSNHHIKDQDITIKLNWDSTLTLKFLTCDLTLDLTSIMEWAKQREEFEDNKTMVFNDKVPSVIAGENEHYKVVFDPSYINWGAPSNNIIKVTGIEGRILIKKL